MKIGDVVCRKVGGYLMTVRDIKESTAICDWFDENGKHRGGWFSLGELQRWIPAG